METVIDITDKKQITRTFIHIVSFTCQRLTKIINNFFITNLMHKRLVYLHIIH
jgi:hypothetical protein